MESNRIPVDFFDELSFVNRRKLIQIVCSIVSRKVRERVHSIFVFYSDSDMLSSWNDGDDSIDVFFLPESYFYVSSQFTKVLATQSIVVVDCQGSQGSIHMLSTSGISYSDHSLSLHEEDVIDSFREMAVQQFKRSFNVTIAPNDVVYTRLAECCKEAVDHLESGDQRVSITLKYVEKNLKVFFTRSRLLFVRRSLIRKHLLDILIDEEGRIDDKICIAMYGSGILYETLMDVMKNDPIAKSVTVVKRTRRDGDQMIIECLNNPILVPSSTPLYIADMHMMMHIPQRFPLTFQSVHSQGGFTVIDEETIDNVTTLVLTRYKQNEWSGPTLLLSLQEGVSLESLVSTSSDRFIAGVLPSSFYEYDSTVTDHNYVFVGLYEEGHRNGSGVVQYITKPISYTTCFCMDERSGLGDVLYRGQRIWHGEYICDYPEGYGWSFNGLSNKGYIGEYSSGEYDSYGCEVYEGRETQSSYYQNGFSQYRSISFLPDRSLVEGLNQKDALQGRGVCLEPDGSVSFGIWKKGQLHGIGEKYQQNGCVEYGEYKDGMREGYIRLFDHYGHQDAVFTKNELIPLHADHIESSLQGESEDDSSDEEALETAWVTAVDKQFTMMECEEVAEDHSIQHIFEEMMGLSPPPISNETPFQFHKTRDFYFLHDWFDGSIPPPDFIKNLSIVFEKKNEGFMEGRMYFKKEKVVYEGEFKDNKFNGQGILYYPNGNKAYEGMFRNNRPHGHCVSYFPNECLEYDGTWKDGIKEGDGCQYRKVNLKYCNSAYRQYLIEKAYDSNLSFAKGFDPYSIDPYSMG